MRNEATFASFLTTPKRLAILVHQKPDGDALGSAVALQRALVNQKTTIVCASPVPIIFEKILPAFVCQSSLPPDAESIVILDCAELHRTGFKRQLSSRAGKIPVIVIDHHPIGDISKIADHYYQRRVSSTVELVAELLDEMRVVVTPEIATALLLGLYTDTGGFQHSNTNAKTLALASRLVRYGGDILSISNQLQQAQSVAQARLWGQVLSRIRVNAWGVVVAQVPKTLLRQTKTSVSDVSGLGNILALITEAKASLVMVEEKDGWRGSLRTRHLTVDVGQLARHLGGQGRPSAGGFMATIE